MKEKREKQTDNLVAILRDTVVAYQSEGSAEQRLKALEKMIGGNRGQRVLENCENHLAYTGNNYFSFMWKHLKSNRSELMKMLESLELKSTTQNKGLEQAISFLLENKNKKSEWIPSGWNTVGTVALDSGRQWVEVNEHDWSGTSNTRTGADAVQLNVSVKLSTPTKAKYRLS